MIPTKEMIDLVNEFSHVDPLTGGATSPAHRQQEVIVALKKSCQLLKSLNLRQLDQEFHELMIDTMADSKMDYFYLITDSSEKFDEFLEFERKLLVESGVDPHAARRLVDTVRQPDLLIGGGHDRFLVKDAFGRLRDAVCRQWNTAPDPVAPVSVDPMWKRVGRGTFGVLGGGAIAALNAELAKTNPDMAAASAAFGGAVIGKGLGLLP